MSRPVWVCFLLSFLLHLTGLFIADEFWWQDLEVEAFRARLLTRPKFVQPPRATFARPDLPRVEMEYLRSEAVPREVAELALPGPSIRSLEGEGIPIPGAAADELLQPKAGGPELAWEEMPSPVGEVFVDSFESEGMELLGIEDLAQADRVRAVIIPDLHSRRDVRGYVNFTSLWLDGAGGFAFEGKPVLEDLARYVRDYTQILARIRGGTARYFFSDELLKDPVHFLFPVRGHAGSSQLKRIDMSDEEIEQLSRYLKNGGFLFVDAGASSDDRWFLREMVDYLRRALGAEGRLFKIPAGHAIYHSFYSYEEGFPGEERMEGIEGWANPWFYPERVPCGEIARGLWGIEFEDELIGVISDLDLHLRWSGEATFCDTAETEEETEEPPVRTPYLQAATNVVVYALTRPGGLTVQRARPAWEQQTPARSQAGDFEEVEAELDEEVLGVLGASLALVHAPLGEGMRKDGLQVKVDGSYTLEVLKRGIDGVLLHNLPAGPHRIEIEYGGRSQRMDVELQGRRVLTVGFKLRGLGFLTVLSMTPFAEQVWVEEWGELFADLVMEEVYFAEELAP